MDSENSYGDYLREAVASTMAYRYSNSNLGREPSAAFETFHIDFKIVVFKVAKVDYRTNFRTFLQNSNVQPYFINSNF